MRLAIEAGDIQAVGDLLHQSWMAKRQLASGVSNDRIDRLYTLARDRGAAGGKITGAGGGGFLLLYCESFARAAVIEAMESEGLYRMEFRFDTGGARVLVNNLSSPGMPIRVGGATAEVFGGAR
ncbi:MAG: hypothetical protein HYX51_11500 [Chloroflexi bacterium]|nr:hypothetical protein [Chloroflexota bacterium]